MTDARPHRTWLAAALAALAMAAVGVIIAISESDESAGAPAAGSVSATPTERTITIPTSGWKPGSVSLSALRTGVLRATPDGCPYLAPRDPRAPATDRTPLVWPADYTARYAKDGKLEILAPNGAVVVREGDHFSAGGGLVPISPQPCTFGATDAFVIMDDLTR